MARGELWWRMLRYQIAVALAVGLVLAVGGVGLEPAAAFTRSRLAVSLSPDRARPVSLDGAKVKGKIYVFVRTPRKVDRVDFHLDDPRRRQLPIRTERHRPYDLAGTAANGTALPFDTTVLAEGRHTVTVVLRWANGSKSERRGSFIVANRSAKPLPRPGAKPTSTRPTPSSTPTSEKPTPSETPSSTVPTTTRNRRPAPRRRRRNRPPRNPRRRPLPPQRGIRLRLLRRPRRRPPQLRRSQSGSWPSAPPAKICGNASVLDGPATPPAGAVVVPAGNNRCSTSVSRARRTGSRRACTPWVNGEYSQIIPGDDSTYVGAPGSDHRRPEQEQVRLHSARQGASRSST